MSDNNLVSQEDYNKYLDGELQLLMLFDELPFFEKIRRVKEGLRCPQDSGEYKWAKFQILRLWAPVLGILTPLIAVIILICLNTANIINRGYEVVIVDPEKVEVLEELKPIEEIEVQYTEFKDIEFKVDTKVDVENPVPGPNIPFSPQPAPMDAVAITKSPIILRGVYGGRNPGCIGSALRQFGGNNATEDAVLKALRWLKKEQDYDGSWKEPKAAMTGLALLTFLAHGETPSSEEFGKTVEKAITWLINNQKEDGTYNNIDDGKGYSIPIATYAICEAFGMTKIPLIKDKAVKGIDFIIKGQHASGGWDYMMKQSTRDDTSVMGWCVQALKAAKMAGLENEKLNECMNLAVQGIKQNCRVDHAWKYTNTDESHGRLCGAGVLCLQFLYGNNVSEVRNGLKWIEENATFDWHNPWGAKPIYYWYYTTQAKFHFGGDPWNKWNKQFAPQLVHNQIVLKGAGIDGKDIGYWDTISNDEKYGLVYNTTLCTLMLEVYYRYLPTFKPIEIIKEEGKDNKEDVDIDVSGSI